MKRKHCLSETSNENPTKKLKEEVLFMSLSAEEQLLFLQNKKRVMEQLWNDFNVAKEKGQHRDAVNFFSEMYQMGYFKANLGLVRDAVCSLPIIKLGDNLDPQESYLTGLQYLLGLGFAVNYGEAIVYFQHAAEKGHLEAQNVLGQCYLDIKEIQDDEKGIYWCKKSALQKCVIAQYHLGFALATGKGITKDLKEACDWFKKAAEQGHVVAQCNLGVAFSKGLGVTKDLKAGFDWYKKAAEQGHANAYYLLGLAYVRGEGVIQDLKEGVFWLRKSAEKGLEKALNRLKQIEIPLALYTVSLIEKNQEALVKMIISHEEVQDEFLKEDCFYITDIYPEEPAVSEFMACLQKQAKILDKDLTSFLVNWLIKLDLRTRCQGIERKESLALC